MDDISRKIFSHLNAKEVIKVLQAFSAPPQISLSPSDVSPFTISGKEVRQRLMELKNVYIPLRDKWNKSLKEIHQEVSAALIKPLRPDDLTKFIEAPLETKKNEIINKLIKEMQEFELSGLESQKKEDELKNKDELILKLAKLDLPDLCMLMDNPYKFEGFVHSFLGNKELDSEGCIDESDESDVCAHLVKLDKEKWSNIETLNFSKSFLNELPNTLRLCGQLRTLQIISEPGYSLLNLPEWLEELKDLKKLVITFSANLRLIPKSFKRLENLEHLSFNGCETLVGYSIQFVCWLTNLQHLDLGNCGVRYLSPEIAKLKNLQVLYLGPSKWMSAFEECQKNGNTFSDLPKEIGSLTNLKILDLESCKKLRNLPSEINKLTQLETLNLSHCENLTVLPETIGELKQLKELRLDGLSWPKLPQAFENFRDLEILSLQENKSLLELPSEINKLTQLKTLNLSHCENLKVLPETIGKLKQLKELRLDGRSWTELPKAFENFENLEILSLRKNKHLLELPSSIVNLASLKDLYLDEAVLHNSNSKVSEQLQKYKGKLHICN